MDILKFVESLPDSIKNIVISALINSSIASKNVEQDLRTVDQPSTINYGQGQKQYKRQSTVNFLKSLKQGDYNSEYVDYYYEVLRRADELVNNSTPDQLMMLAEKYNIGDHAVNRYKFLDKNQRQIHGNKRPDEIKRMEYSRRSTSDDNFPIEIIVTNKKHVINLMETAAGAPPVYNFSLKVQHTQPIKNNIENITEFLHIKEAETAHNVNGRILEFYIPKRVGVKHMELSNHAVMNELKNIVGVSFSDNYGQISYYRVHGFYKIGENGGYDVIKFIGNKIVNVGFL